MHAEQLVGAPVIDSDGNAVGTVEQVFRDDLDGTPSWARVRSAEGLHFVPLAGGRMTSGGGLSVPFDVQKIMKEPELSIDRHMSVEQEDELRRYFELTVPVQPGPGMETSAEQRGGMEPDLGMAAGPGTAAVPVAWRAQAGGQAESADDGQEWLIRSEERFAINMETRESGRVRLRKRVDTEPVQQKVRVFHEEYEVERVPVGLDDKMAGEIGEGDQQEIILHEARAVVSKETVPVERIRLSAKRVEEEQTISDQLRKERIEIDNGTG
jgi:uncharacterized protein (TIGR02271 family)